MDNSINSKLAHSKNWTQESLQKKISITKVILFCRGDSENTLCGFSKRLINALDRVGHPYEKIDVKQSKSASSALKKLTGRNYHHLPALFVDGKIVEINFNEERMCEEAEISQKVSKLFS